MANFRAATALLVGLVALVGLVGLNGCDEPTSVVDERERVVTRAHDTGRVEISDCWSTQVRSKATPAPPPSPVIPLGDITVSVDPTDAFIGIEIAECGRIRARAVFYGGIAVLRDIPLHGACKLNFKGGPDRATWSPVKGATAWACSLRDSELTCVPDTPPSTAPEAG